MRTAPPRAADHRLAGPRSRTHDSSLYETTTSVGIDVARSTCASASGMRRRSLNTLFVAGSRAVDALARDAVVLGRVPRDQRLPDVVVREVAVLVVGRVEVREIERPERARRLARVAPDRRAPARRAARARRSSSGRYDRGAHCFTYAICTPVVESTRSAASIRLVSSTGYSHELAVVALDRVADRVDPPAVVRLEEARPHGRTSRSRSRRTRGGAARSASAASSARSSTAAPSSVDVALREHLGVAGGVDRGRRARRGA